MSKTDLRALLLSQADASTNWLISWMGARGRLEPGSQGDPIDLFALLKPELMLVTLVLGGSAILAFVLGISAGWAWRAHINRKTSWWWFLWVALALAFATVVVGVGLLLQGFR